MFKDFFDDGFTRTNADGRIAMRNSLTGTGVTSSNASGIWSEASGPLRLVARKGDPAPGAGAGVTFTTFEALAPSLNSSGQTLFRATLSDPATPGYSIWLDDAGSLSMLAKYGQYAPGFGPNATFGSLDGTMRMNEVGDIVFEAGVAGTGLPYSPDAIYFMDNGAPRLFMSEWQMFDGQMVGGLSLEGLNDLRQMLVYVTFVGPDGAAFTSDDIHGYYLVTIPEPATLALLAAGSFAIVRRRRA